MALMASITDASGSIVMTSRDMISRTRTTEVFCIGAKAVRIET